MRKIISALGVLAALSLAVPHATAGEANVTVDGGSVSTTSSNVAFSPATLTGSNQTVNASAASAWETTDSRGTGAAWTVSISSTDLVSVAGTVETTPRTIVVGNLKATVGTVTAGTDSDPATGLTKATDLALTGADQTLLGSSGNHKGTYGYTPAFALTIPANAYRSNWSGAVGSSTLNPYTATLTVTTV